MMRTVKLCIEVGMA